MDQTPALSRRRLLAATAVAGGLAALPTPVSAVSPATRAVRRRFFGANNVAANGKVRKDRVILSWFGVTNFALAIGGEVLLLDAWIARGTYSGYVPATVQDLVDLAPSHILIGHGHYDHAADAHTVASASRALVVGTKQQCAQIREQAVKSGGRPVRTRPLIGKGEAEGTHAAIGVGRVRVEAVKHIHSATRTPRGDDDPLLVPPDPGPCLEHPSTLAEGLDTLSHAGDDDGGFLSYRIGYRGFNLVWHDTSGPLDEDAPRARRRLETWRRADVQVGSIQGAGQYTNGLRDPMQYVAAVRPRVFIPAHHDNWQPPVSGQGSGYQRRLREALDALPFAPPKLKMIRDPQDYVTPIRLK